MDNLVNLIQKVEGHIVDVGYGNGSFSRKFKAASNLNRGFYVFDSFENAPIGPAIDFVNSNLSATQIDSQAFDTIDIDEVLLWVKKAALVRINVDDYPYSYRLIECTWPLIPVGGIIVVQDLSTKVALKRFASSKEAFKNSVVELNDFSYLVKKKKDTTFNNKVTRTWSSTLT